MTVRRHITIDEIDDSVDSLSPTAIHVPSMNVQSEAETSTPTDLPEAGDDRGADHVRSPVTVGHTFADLVVLFKNDYRSMAVILTLLPMMVFAFKIDSLESLIYPLFFAGILNLVWFGLPPIVVSYKRRKKES